MGDADHPQESPAAKPAPDEPPASAKKYWWAAAIVVPLVAAVIGVLPNFLKKDSPGIQINADSHDFNFQQINVIEREYKDKTGQPLPPDVREKIDQALTLLKARKFSEGVPLLEAAAEKTNLPSVYADLGNALAATGKRDAAQQAFDQAEKLDPGNKHAERGRHYLGSLTSNNSIQHPAPIEVGQTVSSTLLDNDVDFFQFQAPSGPRDLMRLSLRNKSDQLGLHALAMNQNKEQIGEGSAAAPADLTMEFPMVPGETHYLRVSPFHSGGGNYTLTVTPLRRFDKYEPNETILTPKEIDTGAAIEANILDGEDRDFYRFRAKGAKTQVSLENRSTDFGLRLKVTNAQKEEVCESARPAAANVSCEAATKPGEPYQIEVSRYMGRNGPYILTVR